MKVCIFVLLLLAITTPVFTATCSPAIVGCLNCQDADATKCDQCDTGYALSFSAGTCTACAPGLGKGADPPLQTADTTCTVTCTSPCNICGASPGDCVACIAGYYAAVDTAKTCLPCSGGKGIAAETAPANTATTCGITCDPTCNGCTATSTECLTCAGGHYSFLIGSSKVCVPCGYGKGRAAETDPTTSRIITTCGVYCAPACQSCGATRTACTNCAAGFYLSAANTCSNCPPGFGKPADVSTVQPSTTDGATECSSACHASCNWCRGPGADECVNCNAGYNFDGAGTCNPCADGRTKSSDSTVYTFASPGCNDFCDSTCRTCITSSSSSCKKCNNVYRWNGSGTCTGCPAGKGKLGDTVDNTGPALSDDVCDVTCTTGCRNCYGTTISECTSCTAGYYRSSNTCTVCGDGRGKGSDGSAVVNSGSSNFHCTTICNANCNVCSGSAIDNCLNCKAGYYLSALGTCSFCPDGKTKLKDTTIHTALQLSTVCSDNCDTSCRYCTGTSSNNCMACVGGYYWGGSGFCNECPVGKGRAPDTTVNIGAALVNTAACGITCNEACRICKGTTAAECMKCAAGFYLSAANTCTMCPVGFGKAADLTFPVIATMPNGSDLCTVTCATGCKTCSTADANQCLSCLAGYFYAGAGTCTICETGKGKAADSGIMTVGTTSTLACTAICHGSCLTCSGAGANQCIKCAAGHFLESAGTCTMCPVGFGKAADATVLSPGTAAQCDLACDTSCRTCASTGASNCLNCNQGFFYFGSGTCTRCSAGKGKALDTTIYAATTNDLACGACHESCSSCKGPGATDCLLCQKGYYLSAANTCSMCAGGSGKTADTTTPTITTGSACDVTCHPSCHTCETNLAVGCVNCNSGFWWSGSGCTACANGKTKARDASYQVAATTETAACTLSCDTGCQICSGNPTPNCDYCAAAFFYSATGVCTPCNAGRGKPADTGAASTTIEGTACNACHESCSSCSGLTATTCIKCSAGHYLSASGVCSMCPTGKGKIADAVALTAPSTDSGTTECGLTCHSSCRTCSGTSETECISCAAGFYFAGSGRCTQCASGKGRAQDTTVQTAVLAAEACDITCHNSCELCSSIAQTSCIMCKAGHFLSATGTCTLCNQGKGKATDTTIPTVTTSEAACGITCHWSCRACASSGLSCVNCKAAYFMEALESCTACPSGIGKDDDIAVATAGLAAAACTSQCHESCSQCRGTAATQCLNCKAGYFLSAEGTCSICPDKFGKILDVPNPLPTVNGDGAAVCQITCDPTCRTCLGTAANQCVLCAASHFLSEAGVCTPCGDTTGKAKGATLLSAFQVQTDCVTCHATCLRCQGATATDCLSCKAGSFLSNTGTCTMCPAGQGKAADTGATYPTATAGDGTTECSITCHATCRTCSGPGATECLNCAAGYWWAGSGTCTLCNAGNGKDLDTTFPMAAGLATDCNVNCHESCSKCKAAGATNCLNCKAGYFLSAAGTCSMCPQETGKTTDAEFPLPTIGVFSAHCTTACHPSCRTCLGTEITSCLNCNNGYWWAGSGTCTPCEPGRGKPLDTTIVEAASSGASCTAECDRSCKLCISAGAGNCLSCNAGFFKASETGCSLCPNYKGKAVDPNPLTATTDEGACESTCHTSCLNCRGPGENECISCAHGYFLSAEGVCSMCPSGFGHTSQPEVQALSTTSGAAECPVSCHATCRTCFGPGANQCTACMGGRIWNSDSGVCEVCPATKGSPVDIINFRPPNLTDSCDVTCHASCQMCTGPTENDCLNCNAGYWWAGSGKCTSCPQGKGKPVDTELFPTAALTLDACYIYCDLCTSGCKTCTSDPTTCSSCVTGRLFDSGKCLSCPDNCLACSATTTCTTCSTGYLLSKDASICSKCAVENCEGCETDVGVCTKCKEKYTLKSTTECVLTPTPTPTASPLTDVTPTNTPGLKLDILSDTTNFELGKTESKTVSAVYVTDKLTGKKHTCQELGCTHFSTATGISVKFNSDITVQKGVLTIERVDPTTTKAIIQNPRSRILLEAYPLVIENFVVLGKSNLKPFSYALRIIVGILRLPLSLVIFWKFPRWAMLMDFMVTHLRMYSLLGEPYMAYVEVIFQTVANSQILPFNFDNPFEKWNPDTLTCSSLPSLKSKNLNCSFFDNYGESIIGFASLAVLLVIMHFTGVFLSKRDNLSPRLKTIADTLTNGYGYQFFVAKLDANHLEIILFTIISYSTADSSSKSVVGIIFSTMGLIGFFLFAAFLTKISMNVWEQKPLVGRRTTQERPSHIVVQDTENEMMTQQRQAATANKSTSTQITDKVTIPVTILFAFAESMFPGSKLSIWLHAGRYFRAILLAIFVGVVRNPVEQIVLVIILESCYLCHLLLFDYRGTKAEKILQLTFQGLILLHLLFRAIATSKSLSDVQVHSVLSTMIVVVLVTYIFVHIIIALLSVVALFFKAKETPESEKPKGQAYQEQKIEVLDFHSVKKEEEQRSQRRAEVPQHANEMPGTPHQAAARPPMSSRHNGAQPSVRGAPSMIDLDIPDEQGPDRTVKFTPGQTGFVDRDPTTLHGAQTLQ